MKQVWVKKTTDEPLHHLQQETHAEVLNEDPLPHVRDEKGMGLILVRGQSPSGEYIEQMLQAKEYEIVE